MLHALSAWITEHTDALAVTLTREGGKPLVENQDEMGWSAAASTSTPSSAASSEGASFPRAKPVS